MMRIFFTLNMILAVVLSGMAQPVDRDLLNLKKRMDSVAFFEAVVNLEVDISFISMPAKKALITYERGKKMKIDTRDFVLLPKRGLDFSLNSLTEYPYLTVDRGMETRRGRLCKVINIIPLDNRADFSIATVWLDLALRRIQCTEVNTKKDGSYHLALVYNKEKDLLPGRVEVEFEVENIRIPLNLAGKGTITDKKQLKENGTKTGKIFLTLAYNGIKMYK